MDAKELRDLIELISKSNFVTFELEREGFKLKLEKGVAPAPAPQILVAQPSAPAAVLAPQALPLHVPVSVASTAGGGGTPAEAAETGLADMTSPIVGTFYRQPSPGSPPFVEVGGHVKKGQVVCIIEAMKLMNEIEAEMDADVVEVLVANGQPVEYGEVLFRLRPTA